MIPDKHADPVASRADTDLDLAVRRREFCGVGQQIGQHLVQAQRIHLHGQPLHTLGDPDVHLVLLGVRPVLGNGLFHDVHQIVRLHVEAQLAGHQLFHIQQVIDELRQALAVLVGDLQQGAHLGRQAAHGAAGEQADGAGNRGQRGAQLMAHGGQELGLHPVGLPCLLHRPLQGRGALLDLGLQVGMFLLERLVAVLDFGQHAVEVVHQRTNLVVAALGGADAVVLLDRDAVRNASQTQDGVDDDAAQPHAEMECQRRQRHADHHHQTQAPQQTQPDMAQMGHDFNTTDGDTFINDGVGHRHVRREQLLDAPLPGRVAVVMRLVEIQVGKDDALAVGQGGTADVRAGSQSLQHLAGTLLVVERQRGTAGFAHHLRQGLQLAARVLIAVDGRPHAEHQGNGHQRNGGVERQQQPQLAGNGEVAQPGLHRSTCPASLSIWLLRVRPARWAACRLTSNRTR